MISEINKAIKQLTKKAVSAKPAEAEHYSQAVLNLTCAKINVAAYKKEAKS